MSPETFVRQLRMCHAVVKANVGEITHEESLKHPAAGNCVNWVLGHLVATRSNFLLALGGEPVWGDADRKRYDRHGPPIKSGSEAKPLEEIWKALGLAAAPCEDSLRAHPSKARREGPVQPLERP